MGEDTITRKKSFLQKNWLQFVAIVILLPLFGYIAKYMFEEIGNLNDQVVKLNSRVEDMQRRELDIIWTTLRSFNEKINDSRVRIMVLDEIYGRLPYEYEDIPEENLSPEANRPHRIRADEIKEDIIKHIEKDQEYEDKDVDDFKREQQIKKR